MKLTEAHVQLSPEDETCDLCVQEEAARSANYNQPFIEANTIIKAFTEYHWVGTQDGMFYNLCDTHYYEEAQLPNE